MPVGGAGHDGGLAGDGKGHGRPPRVCGAAPGLCGPDHAKAARRRPISSTSRKRVGQHGVIGQMPVRHQPERAAGAQHPPRRADEGRAQAPGRPRARYGRAGSSPRRPAGVSGRRWSHRPSGTPRAGRSTLTRAQASASASASTRSSCLTPVARQDRRAPDSPSPPPDRRPCRQLGRQCRRQQRRPADPARRPKTRPAGSETRPRVAARARQSDRSGPAGNDAQLAMRLRQAVRRSHPRPQVASAAYRSRRSSARRRRSGRPGPPAPPPRAISARASSRGRGRQTMAAA